MLTRAEYDMAVLYWLFLLLCVTNTTTIQPSNTWNEVQCSVRCFKGYPFSNATTALIVVARNLPTCLIRCLLSALAFSFSFLSTYWLILAIFFFHNCFWRYASMKWTGNEKSVQFFPYLGVGRGKGPGNEVVSYPYLGWGPRNNGQSIKTKKRGFKLTEGTNYL